MEINERALITELRDNKYIDPQKYSLQMLKRLKSYGYIVLLLNAQKQAIYVGKGKSSAKALALLNIE